MLKRKQRHYPKIFACTFPSAENVSCETRVCQRVRCFTWNIDRPEKVSRETVLPCSAPMFHMKQKCHPFGWHLSLSIKSVFTPKQQSRGSAHSKAFAAQTHENRGRVPRFSYFKREKVSVWELSDVRVLRSQNTDCRKNDSFSTVDFTGGAGENRVFSTGWRARRAAPTGTDSPPCASRPPP